DLQGTKDWKEHSFSFSVPRLWPDGYVTAERAPGGGGSHPELSNVPYSVLLEDVDVRRNFLRRPRRRLTRSYELQQLLHRLPGHTEAVRLKRGVEVDSAAAAMRPPESFSGSGGPSRAERSRFFAFFFRPAQTGYEPNLRLTVQSDELKRRREGKEEAPAVHRQPRENVRALAASSAAPALAPWFGPAAMPGELGGTPEEGKAPFFTPERGRGTSRDATKTGARSPSRESALSNTSRMTGLSEKSRRIVDSILLRREQAKEEKRRRERENAVVEMAALRERLASLQREKAAMEDKLQDL
ncbi:MAG: hypothetical protein BJ554DRAFT_6283, partial [Olpidium bornovanus]